MTVGASSHTLGALWGEGNDFLVAAFGDLREIRLDTLLQRHLTIPDSYIPASVIDSTYEFSRILQIVHQWMG
jgi:hypothetical protein